MRHTFNRCRGFLAGAVLGLGLPGAELAHADTNLTVLTPAALITAMAAGGTVNLATNGTVLLTQTIDVTNSVILDAAGYTVVISGGFANDLTSTNGVRLFSVRPNQQFTLRNLTLANGRSTNGGAIYNRGLLLLTNCVFTNNIAIGAAGTNGPDGPDAEVVAGPGGNGIEGSPANGGALFNTATSTVLRCAFINNRAIGGDGGAGGTGGDGRQGGNGGNGANGAIALGGAIYNAGQLGVTNSTMQFNLVQAGNGGDGGDHGAGPIRSYLGNGGLGAYAAGAGIYNASNCAVASSSFIENEVRSGNSASAGTMDYGKPKGGDGADAAGGGLANFGTNTLLNCTFYTNSVVAGNGGNGGAGNAGGDGGRGGNASGGNYYNARHAEAHSCTLSSGHTIPGTNGLGGGVGFNQGNPGAMGLSRGDNMANDGSLLRLRNSIVAYWVESGNFSGTITDAGFNLNSDTTPVFLGTGSLTGVDPLLVVPADNGGPTETMALQEGSPAINKGTTNDCLPTDQRGVPRPFDGRCDMGAFEFGAVAVPPVITLQPTNQTVVRGAAVTNYVTVESDVVASYQWTFNGTNIAATRVPSALTSTLVLTNVQSTNAGSYAVIVENAFGVVTSVVATLTVTIPLSILEQPRSVSTNAGATATFRVSAESSSPITYQWLRNDAALVSATASNLTFSSVSAGDAGRYQVIVSSEGLQIRSVEVTLTVLVPSPPKITEQPTNMLVFPGDTAITSVTATGDEPLRYQWYSDGTILMQNYTNSWLGFTNIGAADTGVFSVVITNNYGAVTSAPATLQVIHAAVITRSPTDLNLVQGSTAVFDVEATGTPAPSYQWFFNGNLLAAQTNRVLTLTNVQKTNGGNYTVTATNLGGAVTSTVARLTVGVTPTITQPPTSIVVYEGEPAVFTVTAVGDSPLAYQWQRNGVAIAGATTNRYVIASASLTNAGLYTVVVTNLFGSVTSVNASLEVNVPLRIITQSHNQIVPTGSDVSLSVTVAGRAPLNYLWSKDGVALPGGNSNSRLLRDVKASQVGAYDVEIWNDFGELVVSDPMNLTVFTPLTNQNAVESNNVAFAVTATVPVGAPALSFQWFRNGAALAGATTSRYDITNVNPNHAGEYRLLMRDSSGATNNTASTLVVWRLHDLQPARNGTSFAVTFGSLLDSTYILESTGALPSPATNWIAIDLKMATTNILTLTDSHATNGMRFYRVRLDAP